MSEAEDEQLTVGPSDVANDATTEPVIKIISTRTYLEIAEHYLNDHVVKEDIQVGSIDLTFAEATKVMAADLAEFFRARGKLHGVDTLIPGEISNAAVLGIPRENGKKKIYPVNVAFGMTLGKIRSRRIVEGINDAIERMAAHRDADGQRRLRAQLSLYKKATNFTKIGAGNTYTVTSAIDHAINLVSIASDRGGSPTLAADTLSRIMACKAAEESTVGPAFTAIKSASLPAEVGSHADRLEVQVRGTLDNLLRWDEALEYGEVSNLTGALDLARQCAQMDYLQNEQLDLLSDDVARRIHHPFGLMNVTGHAGMVAGLYLYTGEAPYEVLKLASAYMDASAAEQHFSTGDFAALVNAAQSSLDKAVKNSRVRWTGKVTLRPTAMDILRLLAATTAKAIDNPGDPEWPEGLLEELLRNYEVRPEDLPAGVNLLKKAFSISMEQSGTGPLAWWDPSTKWNTTGSRIMERIATFDYSMTSEDRDDLKAKADKVLPFKRLSELRDNLVRGESEFSQTVRKGEDRSVFIHESLMETNKWLWKFGRLQAIEFFAAVKHEKESAYRFLRGITAERVSPGPKAPVSSSHHQSHGDNGTVQSPKDWFSIATSKDATLALMREGAGAKSSTGPRTTADLLLDIVTRAENFPYTRPAQGRSIPDWISERVDELNLLEEDMDDLVDLYQRDELSSLLEAVVRALKEKETGQ
ncbi:hypothetical protein [Pseudarthrobacter sp. B4EP4b]|uniref:hypothetical protein n=1 Tax=Pseudarthrobacter sp. B4EP4b TaxID=2590664 RepID=UPI001150347D|nr:hypothetical protein [Pseudarthrobacter sp. B4EP4b]